MTRGKRHPDMVAIGERIRARRDYLWLLRREVADALGIAPERLKQWEEGINIMPGTFALPLAAALRVRVGYLFGEPEESAPALTPQSGEEAAVVRYALRQFRDQTGEPNPK